MFIEVGPASMYIVTEKCAHQYDPERTGTEAFLGETLRAICDVLPILHQKAWKIVRFSHLPEVAVNMIHAASAVDGTTLTPMAAVAGAVSEALKGYLEMQGFDFISVNNGGDIAISNPNGRDVSIAVGDIEPNRISPYTVIVRGVKSFGVATSGFRGRSFTLGVADSVTVVADSAHVADAAATFIANQVNVESPSVLRKRAGDIDSNTDICEELVTVTVGYLREPEIAAALERGLAVAQSLKDGGVIREALLLLKKRMVTTMSSDKNIRLEVNYGNT